MSASAQAPLLSERLLCLRKEWRMAHQENRSKDCDATFRSAIQLSQQALEASDPALLERVPILLNERLARDGREWERLIVQVAATERAAFGTIEYEIEVADASRFHSWLENELLALHGGILFTESASLDAYQNGKWSGRTYCFFPEPCRNWSLTPLESFTGLVQAPRITQLL